MDLQVFEGYTKHVRTAIKRHELKYPLFFLHVATSKKSTRNFRFFSINKLNLYSVYAQDYLQGKPGALESNLREFLTQNSINVEFTNVTLQTSPRVLGFQFNPVSFWFLRNATEKVISILVEVNNTFGERHFYFIEENAINNKKHKTPKNLHESPFCKVEGYYKFKFSGLDTPPSKVKIDIDYFNDKDELQISTYIYGEPSAMKDFTFVKLLINYGWFSLVVLFRIHLNALFLWKKGIQFYSKPALRSPAITKGNVYE